MAVYNFREKDLTPFFFFKPEGKCGIECWQKYAGHEITWFWKVLVLADYVKVDTRLAQFNLESLVAREESWVSRPRPQDAYSLQA